VIHAHQAAKGPLPPEMATKIVLHLARAVGHAHKLSPPIVHRDLKPANVLVRTKGGGSEVFITDFGIGGVVASQAREQTRRGTTSQPLLTSLKGAYTPLYASTEQKRGLSGRIIGASSPSSSSQKTQRAARPLPAGISAVVGRE
jgi:serine/threonine protein kinase